MAMKLYKQFLYVGLGGTGLEIGVALEQALRAELCGPDGMQLMNRDLPGALEPFQLPRCTQFVYLDFDESARSRAKGAGVTAAGQAAAAATAQVVPNLTPKQNSFTQAAQMLRISATETVKSWLPGPEGEPQRFPLSEGAGQLPTVGRAALFETFRLNNGPAPVTNPLGRAFGQLAQSAGDLAAISNDRASKGIDIFVGFSVAGGTGAGIFYDVLRLIAHVAEVNRQHDAGLSIYPLVVMPSAFATRGTDAPRPHRLNGGPALQELFELVDYANGAPEEVMKIRPVRYPGGSGVSPEAPVPVKTAFLFSKPASIKIEDLHRSIVAFVLSVTGTTINDGKGETFTPLSAQLINDPLLAAPAPDGAGKRPAASALAAELRIPVETIANLLANRLLANATRELREPEPTEKQDNVKDLFEQYGSVTGLSALARPAPTHRLPDLEGRGASEIAAELRKRARTAEQLLNNLRESQRRALARLADEADYHGGVEALAKEWDLFRVSRVVLGHPSFVDVTARDGFRGFVTRRGQQPPDNPGKFTNDPPTPPSLKDGPLGVKKVGVNDKTVRDAIRVQDRWYQWRVRSLFYEVWRDYRSTWEPRLRELEDRLLQTIRAFDEHTAAEPDSFHAGCQALYRERTGVVYFVPDGGPSNNLDMWYRSTVLPRLCEVLNLPEGVDEGRILQKIMHGRWDDAYARFRRDSRPSAAREYVLEAVRQILTERVLAPGEETSLLPRIETLLRVAANQSDAAAQGLSPRMLEIFKRSLVQLLPLDFRPQGSAHAGYGQLEVDVFYPSAQPNGRIEMYLNSTALSTLEEPQRNFHALSGVDFLSVVLRRKSLPATAVLEYREMMALRMTALTPEGAAEGDLLPWRQRLGYDPTWLVLRPDEGARVLAALLTAMWDGSIEVVDGTNENPKVLLVHQLDRAAGPPMRLVLPDEIGVSRWCGLVTAYERYVLSGDETELERCAALLRRTSPTSSEPSELWDAFMDMRGSEESMAKRLVDRIVDQGAGQIGDRATPRVYTFWVDLLPEAERYNADHSPQWQQLYLSREVDLREPAQSREAS
ncbi:MAG TPA: tubulin-like doman-containing protein [Thermoleophilaceae bacterium]|jgi:hypothetical protein